MYDWLGPVAAPWQTLATDAEGQPAIVEAEVGERQVILSEPSLDRYAAANGDAPDNAVSTAVAQTFLRNLMA